MSSNYLPAKEKKQSKCFQKSFFAVSMLLVFAILAGGGYLAHQKLSQDSSSNNKSGVRGSGSTSKGQKDNGEESSEDDSAPVDCPEVPPSKRMLMFWQTEQGGCEKIPDGVTHVFWGFSEVKKGSNSVNLKFQGHTATLKKCIKDLRRRCILSIGSVGGANNGKELSEIKDSNKFADSVVKLAEEYGFDGIDIDDETVGDQFNSKLVVNNVKAVYYKLINRRTKAKKKYIITFDALIFAGVKKHCRNENNLDHSRCFPEGIVKYVDWIHVMAYNIAKDKKYATKIYESAEKDIFPHWVKHMKNDASKVAIGICVGTGCAYGIGPSEKVIAQWTRYSKKAGGMMIYAGSMDVGNNFKATKQILSILHKK